VLGASFMEHLLHAVLHIRATNSCCDACTFPWTHLQGLCVAEASADGGAVLRDITDTTDLAGLLITEE
jgi:hypothetical protein